MADEAFSHPPLARPGLSRRGLLAAALAAGAASGTSSRPAAAAAAAPTAATVAAAADLKFALEELAPEFERRSGHRLRLIFGSSGVFTSQLLQGAPFHLFLSADEQFGFRLADAGRTRDRGRLYARGRIGLMVGTGSPLQADPDLRDLRLALRDGRLQRLAIANPEHAPYGARAREALQALGLWEAVQPRLVMGENVAQAAQFALSGSAQGGIVAQSIALAPAVAPRVRFSLLAESLHQPLLQRMVLMKDAPAAAVAFHDHLLEPAAQALLARYGFALPER